MDPHIVSIFIALLTTALMAGLFYAWEISVIPGIARLDDKGYLKAMQRINRAILNPAFFLIFIGSIISLPVAAIFQFQVGTDKYFGLIAGAAVIYLVAAVAVTAFGNVPMNEQLDKLDLDSLSSDDLKTARTGYEGRWNRLNKIRTAASLIAFVLLLLFFFI